MLKLLNRYMNWLHLKWPAGLVEKLPEVSEDFTTNVKGLYIVGDLTGVPLLKLSADSGVKAVRHLHADKSFQSRKQQDGQPVHDLVIIGGGVAGHAAALEAKKLGLDFVLLEASEAFSTIANFPKRKPIYTYPSEMTPDGDLQFTTDVKEDLLEEMRAQVGDIQPTIGYVERVTRKSGLLSVDLKGSDPLLAHRVIVAIGRSGNYRKLGVPGEDLDKVYNRLHDPKDYKGKNVLVVGGGDSALETALAIAENGGNVTLSYRKDSFSRPKPDNIELLTQQEQAGGLTTAMSSQIESIQANKVRLKVNGDAQEIDNDVVFTMLGREAPLDFFRRSGVRITGESTTTSKLALLLFATFVFLMYDWKGYAWGNFLWDKMSWPTNAPELLTSLGAWWEAQVADRSTLIGTLAVSMKSRSFYYTALYTTAIGVFGIQRILRRRTPYVTVQTISLFLVQLFPLFLIPEIILPYMDYNGALREGFARVVADNLFELYIPLEQYEAGQWGSGHARAYWRAYGFILAWPLSVYNVFSYDPNFWWLAICFIQSFVIIPYLVYRWGKGAFCGWICSCGALAETMGDAQRHKMPHGPKINKLNIIGQVFLAFATILLVWRIAAWIWPGTFVQTGFEVMMDGKLNGKLVNPASYWWFVDTLWAGFMGMAFYFKYSGRVWCRFACPLAALMHIYARFTSFRIFANKKKCISCNVCTSVCHQGIDIMSFANKGLPMEDPQCVRCSACVQSCPTGTLQFGRINRKTGETFSLDSLPASPVLIREKMEV